MKNNLIKCLAIGVSALAIASCSLNFGGKNDGDLKSGLKFELDTASDSYVVAGYDDFTGDKLVVPSTYNGKPVTAIQDYAFKNNVSSLRITSVVIPGSVLTIGRNVFEGFTNLESVTIANGVTEIKAQAFSRCNKLKTIVIPDSVTTIGQYIFDGCYGFESMTLPFIGDKLPVKDAEVTQLPLGYVFGTSYFPNANAQTETEQFYSFYYKNADGESVGRVTSTTYAIPNSLKSVTVTGGYIPQGAFYNCANLTSVTLGKNVTGLGDHSFHYCSNLRTIDYNGTRAEWDALPKAESWFVGTNTYTLNCAN